MTDVVTRWNSAFDMLHRFLEQQPPICATLLSAEMTKPKNEVCTFRESDITSVEEFANDMKPVKVARLANNF